jgi:hypothetical protein
VAPAEDQAFFQNRGGHRFVNPELAGTEFAFVVAGDSPEAEFVLGTVVDVRKILGVEVGLEEQRTVGSEVFQFGSDFVEGVLSLVEVEIDVAVGLAFEFSVEIPGHAIDECGRAGVAFDGCRVFEEIAIAECNAVHPFERRPVLWTMIDAPTIFHQHRFEVVVKGTRRTDVDFDPHCLPAMNLMVKFSVGPAERAGVTDDAEEVDQCAFP